MKEIDIFESWINTIQEGTWAIPSKPQAQDQLKKLLSEPFPVGADATNAMQTLTGIFGDDELFDQLSDLANSDPNADCRPLILARLNDFKDNPGVANVLAAAKDIGEPQPAPPASPGGEEAMNAPAAEPSAAPPAEAPAPEAPAAPAPEAGGEAPPEEAPPEEAPPEEPVQEDAEDDYDDDLASILKHAGVKPCTCPAEDYITGRDPHLNESNDVIRMSRLLEGRSDPFTGKSKTL